MDICHFKQHIEPSLEGYKVSYSSYLNGDFGNLDRVEIAGLNMLATVEIWSKGWFGIDVYDYSLDEQVMNFLLSPEEISLIPQVLEDLLKKLKPSLRSE